MDTKENSSEIEGPTLVENIAIGMIKNGLDRDTINTVTVVVKSALKETGINGHDFYKNYRAEKMKDLEKLGHMDITNLNQEIVSSLLKKYTDIIINKIMSKHQDLSTNEALNYFGPFIPILENHIYNIIEAAQKKEYKI